MKAIRIEDIKTFTSELFVKNLFDDFLISEAEIATYNTFSINGRINTSYYEEEPKYEFSKWESIKPFVFGLIKGKRLPVFFKIILKLNIDDLNKFIKENSLSAYENKLEECFINIKYEYSKIIISTGIFLNEFTMDKSVDKAWDQFVLNLFITNNIKFNED